MEKQIKKQYTYYYPENKAIGDKLLHGDRIRVAMMSGCNVKYVYRVLLGERNNLKIVEAAKCLIKLQEAIEKAYNN